MSSNCLAHDTIVDLCENDDIPESELISQLQAVLKTNPNVVYESDEYDGQTLLHRAARLRSSEFCQMLVSLNEDLVKTADNEGRLPLHVACEFANTNTAKYLYKLYPESISIQDCRGYTALHTHILNIFRRDNLELLEFLLDNDQGAVSTPDHLGQLALHMAIWGRNFDVTKLVFNTYPDAIHTTDDDGDTPVDNAITCDEDEVIDFFEHQISFERQARTDRTPNHNGQLPIHRAIQSRDASLGAIKLMLAANQASIASADNQGHTPLHIACQAGNLDAAKYLMRVDHDLLKAIDTRGNLPLHLACKQGNCRMISFILEQSTYGVTLQNLGNQTPIELLLFESECDRNSMAYVEAVRLVFEVNPDEILKCLTKKDSSGTSSDKQEVGHKRKRV